MLNYLSVRALPIAIGTRTLYIRVQDQSRTDITYICLNLNKIIYTS